HPPYRATAPEASTRDATGGESRSARTRAYCARIQSVRMRASRGGGAARHADAATTTIPQPTSLRLSIEPSPIIARVPSIPVRVSTPLEATKQTGASASDAPVGADCFSLQLPAEAPSRP